MSKWFPEADEWVARRLLRDGIRIHPGEPALATLHRFEEMGILSSEQVRYVRCALPGDPDYAGRDNPHCTGQVEVRDGIVEYYCPSCGQPFVDITSKTLFVEYEVRIEPRGVVDYLQHALNELDSVSTITVKSPYAFEASIGRKTLTIILPEYSEARASQGLFFAEPTLYIVVSPINQISLTVLERHQYLNLSEFTSCSKTYIDQRLVSACTPVRGKRELTVIEADFDHMVKKGWQYFEQTFVPSFVEYVSLNPEACQNYLEQLRRLEGTIFADYHVPIGGAGKPDLMPISKFPLMNQLLEGGFIGDAKCYPRSSLSYDDVMIINGHLDMDGARFAVVFLAGDSVSSTAWDAANRLRGSPNQPWKIMILPKYLMLELISELDAQHLLNN